MNGSENIATLYPELFAKPHIDSEKKFILTSCSSLFVTGTCPHGTKIAKSIVCGKEHCPDCGKQNSIAHKRRIGRWYNKVIQMKKCGYLVVTVPDVLREHFRDQNILRWFRNYVKRYLSETMNYKLQLIRYHWAGQCKLCKTTVLKHVWKYKNGVKIREKKWSCENTGCRECNWSGMENKFTPHLNILIEEGLLTKKEFEEKISNGLRDHLETIFNRKFKHVLKNNEGEQIFVKGNVNYSYCKNQAHRIHKLKYITRATWRHDDIMNEEAEYMKEENAPHLNKFIIRQTETKKKIKQTFVDTETGEITQAHKWKIIVKDNLVKIPLLKCKMKYVIDRKRINQSIIFKNDKANEWRLGRKEQSIVRLLKGFRTTSSAGKWEKTKPVKVLTDKHTGEEIIVAQIEEGICPCCKEKINWKRKKEDDETDVPGGAVINSKEFLKIAEENNFAHVGAGYFIKKVSDKKENLWVAFRKKYDSS